MTIGQRMKAKRKELKMSADELAKRLGKDRSTIYRYEKGDIENLPLELLTPISEALETTAAYLMGLDVEIEKNPAGMAARHFEIIMDEDINEIFDEFKSLDAKNKKLVKDLIHSLANSES